MPNEKGRFGEYGGQFVPETVMPALIELDDNYRRLKDDPGFKAEVDFYFKEYAGRPTKLYFADNLTKHYGKGKI